METRLESARKYFSPIIFSWKNLIFAQNPSPSITSLPPLFIPFRSIVECSPPPLVDRNRSPNPVHFTSRIRSLNSLCSLCFCSRSFSTFVKQFRRRPNHTSGKSFTPSAPGIDTNQVTEIVELIRRDASDMESKLSQISLMHSHGAVSEILRNLSDRGVSALRFFNWVLNADPSFRPTSEIYNQVVDNLGRWDDYKTMLLMLNELSSKGHCLTEKAFAFLTLRSSAGLKDSVRSVVETLNQVWGSCRGSGVYSLIKLLCAMNSFDLAVLVMEETTRRTSYYNVLIAAKCRNCDFQGARDMFDEMKKFGCEPNTKSYNYLLGSLFKNNRVFEACDLMQTMEALGYLPDSITFELVAYHACKMNRMDFAIEFLNRMLAEGLKPRVTMHASFVKGYFWSGRAEDAYKYVVDMSTKDKCSGNMNYSLLASLFCVSGRVVGAGKILHEMMEKGLRPNFPVYVRVMKDLHSSNRGDLSSELKSMFAKFNPSADSG